MSSRQALHQQKLRAQGRCMGCGATSPRYCYCLKCRLKRAPRNLRYVQNWTAKQRAAKFGRAVSPMLEG